MCDLGHGIWFICNDQPAALPLLPHPLADGSQERYLSCLLRPKTRYLKQFQHPNQSLIEQTPGLRGLWLNVTEVSHNCYLVELSRSHSWHPAVALR